MHCCACSLDMRPAIADWLRRCAACGTWASTLEPRIGDATLALDEHTRASGLETVREEQDERIVAGLVRRVPPGGRVLDIGCGYGWFLLEARDAGYEVEGVEPEPTPADMARSNGIPIRQELFPDCLEPGERFDAIAMHHVVEHLPDAVGALESARDALTGDGVVLLSIPCADGPIFRTAVAAARAGWQEPLRRMFQYGFPSPHVWYLPRAATAAVLARAGLEIIDGEWLASVSRAGLWSRIKYGTGRGPTAIATLAGVGLATPALRSHRPSDTLFVVARARA